LPLNSPEKIVSLYLRLNGFFLMQHFTVFFTKRARHTDVLAVRLSNAEERIGDSILEKDTRFLNELGSPAVDICLVAEIKGSRHRELDQEAIDQVRRISEYAGHMFGTTSRIRKVLFRTQTSCIFTSNGVTQISIQHCVKWILDRLADAQRLANRAETYSKLGSWAWSEDFLSDLLYLARAGVSFTSHHNCSVASEAAVSSRSRL